MLPSDGSEAEAIMRRALALAGRWISMYEDALERAEQAPLEAGEPGARARRGIDVSSLREVANALTICTRAEALRRTLLERNGEGAHGGPTPEDLAALERALSEPVE
jgi:hypothetical protein